MQHLVVPTFVIDPKRHVLIGNRACERSTACIQGKRRHCLADRVALGRPDQLADLYSQ